MIGALSHLYSSLIIGIILVQDPKRVNFLFKCSASMPASSKTITLEVEADDIMMDISSDQPLAESVKVDLVGILSTMLSPQCSTEQLVSDKKADLLLMVRPVSVWTMLVSLAEMQWEQSPSVNCFEAIMHGNKTLYEVLQHLGQEWHQACVALQALAQQRLFAVCRSEHGPRFMGHMPEFLIRSGANVLCVDDGSGRLPAHCAAITGSVVLRDLVRMAPASLLVPDLFGRTPLTELNNSLLLEDGGVRDALVDAALNCVASLPAQTAKALENDPLACEIWQLLAKHNDSLHVVLPEAEEASFYKKEQEYLSIIAEMGNEIDTLKIVVAKHEDEMITLRRSGSDVRCRACSATVGKSNSAASPQQENEQEQKQEQAREQQHDHARDQKMPPVLKVLAPTPDGTFTLQEVATKDVKEVKFEE